MSRDLSRLLRPRAIAVIGGGAWCRAVIAQNAAIGFDGDIWPVHPEAPEVEGLKAYRDLAALPRAPDAAFIGVNRFAAIDIVQALSAMGAGGAVCFASGFAESVAEESRGAGLQARLLEAAGAMPLLGPNCYGFINYLDGALLWPDLHGGRRAASGVAIVAQSSNIAINLTMQRRGLPIAYLVTAGNQAQTGIAEIAAGLLDDPRVTALGLHIEGFGDLGAFEALAGKARALKKPVVALKLGRSAQARAGAVSHTASLAGEDAGAQALLDRLGIARVHGLPAFLETLKLLHVLGPLPTGAIASMSCSGGEAALAADSAHGRAVRFPPLNPRQERDLRQALGPRVALANPLDYHTYIWRDAAALTATFAAMMDPGLALTLLILDFPRGGAEAAPDWRMAVDALIAARNRTGAAAAVVATLPENLPEDICDVLVANGVAPLHGLDDAIAAIEAAARVGHGGDAAPLLRPTPGVAADLIPEAESKNRLAAFGLRIPRAARATSPAEAAALARDIGFPVALKGEGLAHKTEAGAVALNLADADAVTRAAAAMPTENFLVEEMIAGGLAELLVGVVKDPAHGFVLTLAAGGVLTEVLEDSASLLLPAGDDAILAALDGLRIAKLLGGHRGAPPVDRAALLKAVNAVQDYARAHAEGLEDIEINPLICTADDAIAADALIRRKG